MKKMKEVQSFGSEGCYIYYYDGTDEFSTDYDSSNESLYKLIDSLIFDGYFFESFWKKNDGSDTLYSCDEYTREECGGEEWIIKIKNI